MTDNEMTSIKELEDELDRSKVLLFECYHWLEEKFLYVNHLSGDMSVCVLKHRTNIASIHSGWLSNLFPDGTYNGGYKYEGWFDVHSSWDAGTLAHRLFRFDGDVLVSVRWANKVRKLHKMGIKEIFLVPLKRNEPLPKGTLMVTWYGDQKYSVKGIRNDKKAKLPSAYRIIYK